LSDFIDQHVTDPPWLINRKYGNRQTSGLAVEVVKKPEAGRYDFQVSK